MIYVRNFYAEIQKSDRISQTALEPISQVSEMLRLSHRPLHKDGHVEDPKNQSLITRVITQAHDQTKRGNPMPITWQNAVAIIDAWRNGETQGIDDRKLLVSRRYSCPNNFLYHISSLSRYSRSSPAFRQIFT